MLIRIASGIPGLDELLSSDEAYGPGGVPENTSTLIYGPPQVGKSKFCYQFAYEGLSLFEPSLYLTTDYPVNNILERMKDTLPEAYSIDDNDLLYFVDVALDKAPKEMDKSEFLQFSSVHNPTDIIVKISIGTQNIAKKSPRFRAIIDSLTTIMEYNDEMLVIRVLKTYLLRVKEAGGTALINYTEGVASPRAETFLKSMVDNVIRIDGETLVVEAMKGMGKTKSSYQITSRGINLINDIY
jgi:KaiC/GvpD/RAD55 family RecA-like ATPase